jgi:putative ABC transport system substrate-binding protein
MWPRSLRECFVCRVEQPDTQELVVNLRTARALGVTVPPAVLLRVNRIVE